MSVIVLAIVLQVLLFRSRWGLRTRAVGEHPKAAETVGIDVIRLRYRNVILGGVFAGLAGAWFTLDYGNSFQAGMTNGRGFIALAALIFGRWHPLGAFGAALLFARRPVARAPRSGSTPPPASWATILTAHPRAVLRRPALHRHDRRPGRRRRPEHPAGGRSASRTSARATT